MPADAPKKPGPAGAPRPGGAPSGAGGGPPPGKAHGQPAGGQLPPGMKLAPGSQLPPGMKLAPGSQLPPGVKLPPGLAGLSRKQQPKRDPRTQMAPGMNDPFGPAGPTPNFGQLRPWQKIALGLCGLMIATILFIVFATDLIRVPGIETGVLIRHNVDFLGETITLPRKPVSATWQMLPYGNTSESSGTAWRIRAVLEFAPADTEAILMAAKSKPQPPGDAMREANWFPDAVRDAMDTHPTALYDASDFYNSLYRHGGLSHVEGTNYFLLEIYTD
jgi:hypothetical protein